MKVKKFNEAKEEIEPIEIWYSIRNGGDGSAHPAYFLTEEESEYDQDNLDEGWGETCNGMIETYVGSNVHKKAIINSQRQYSRKIDPQG